MEEPAVVGRYVIDKEIASGGMATVHLGRLMGAAGFARTVAIKRLHPHFAKDKEFVDLFVDEARLAARIRHPNVVSTLDVVKRDGEVLLVMDFVEGESLSRIVKVAAARETQLPLPISTAIIVGTLHGLHAAHEATNDKGEPLNLIHRDVSPQNILVGVNGIPMLLDFGIAKAAERSHQTRDGVLKGKIAYMPPELVLGEAEVDRRVDIYAASVVLWEMLTGTRLVRGPNDIATARRILEAKHEPPSRYNPAVGPLIDSLVMKGLSARADDRFATALEMADALEEACSVATPRKVAAVVAQFAGTAIAERKSLVSELESGSGQLKVLPSQPPPKTEITNTEIGSMSASAAARPRRRGLWLGLAAAGVVATIAVAALWRTGGSEDGTAAAEPPANSATTGASPPATAPAVPVAPSPEPAASAASPPAARSAAPAPSASAPAAATSAALPVPTPAKPAPKAVNAPAPKPKPRPAASNCNPPYVIDGAGIKRYKPECFR